MLVRAYVAANQSMLVSARVATYPSVFQSWRVSSGSSKEITEQRNESLCFDVVPLKTGCPTALKKSILYVLSVREDHGRRGDVLRFMLCFTCWILAFILHTINWTIWSRNKILNASLMESIPEAREGSVDGWGVRGKTSHGLWRPTLGSYLFVQRIFLVLGFFLGQMHGFRVYMVVAGIRKNFEQHSILNKASKACGWYFST